MTQITISRAVVEQALEALEYDTEPEPKYGINAAIATLRAALAEPQEPVQVESALQAVAEKIGDQCAVWYGIGARDVEEVLREAARHGLVRAALAEPVQEPEPGEYHGWVLREVLFDNGEPVGHREPVQEPDSPARRCGGPGCDMKCCQPVEENKDA